MRIGVFLLSVSLCAAAPPTGTQARDPELASLSDLARGAPPEFASLTLTRIATSERVKNRTWSVELLEEAFTTAAGAQESYPRRLIAGPAQQGRAAQRHVAYLRGLDRLSLEAAALRGLLAIDAAAGREAYARMMRPQLEPATCRDALVADPSAWFELTATVANSVSRKERAAGEHLAIAERALAGITSPAELAPASRMILAMTLTPPERDLLAGRFAGALERVAGDDRSFSATLTDVEREADRLARSATQPAVVRSSFQKYFSASRTGARCKESLDPEWPYVEAEAAIARRLGLEAAELKPASVDGSVDWESPEKDPEGERLIERWKSLVFNGRNAELPDEDTRKASWRAALTQMIDDVQNWKPAGAGSDEEVAARRGALVAGLVWIAPSGRDRDTLLDLLVTNIRISGTRPKSWMLWFADFEGVLSLTRSTRSAEAPKLLEAFERSDNRVLVLFARLERLLPSGWKPDNIGVNQRSSRD